MEAYPQALRLLTPYATNELWSTASKNFRNVVIMQLLLSAVIRTK
jgi:hypothetical protein